MRWLKLLPPLGDAEVAAGARPGESWEQARKRLEAARYVRAPVPCTVCHVPFWVYAHSEPSAVCPECMDVLEWERDWDGCEGGGMEIEGMSDADYMEIMRKGNEAALEHDREQVRMRDEALAFVATIVSARKLQHIKDYIDECGFTCEFEIVDSHGGERQDETGYAFRYAYIDQRCNGGYSGDDFSGYVWIPLPKGKFLKFHYSC